MPTKTPKPDAAARKAERERRRALLARATVEGVPGLGSERAVLCSDCRVPMLVLQREPAPVLCVECGCRRFVPGFAAAVPGRSQP